ncbi:hypothetical protein D8674_009957 [Pyrus ussuriensis x Pyrus communis]|uniref:Uncharacterized protein n=1 Tax=Pyrus ussuriensis x Pyrus communis TaxID=2448454 RepID=A0A5N5F9D2_9ROSA|nr:hypothetical protein D8674_009957 [Pyrus ussuriensis x Pyrus communis]
MSTSQQLTTITIVASSPDSPPILPITSFDHHHIILAVENTTMILQIPRRLSGLICASGSSAPAEVAGVAGLKHELQTQ